MTEHLIYIYIYTRGELTIGAKRLVGAKQSVGKRLEAKRLGEEMIGAKRPGFPKTGPAQVRFLGSLPTSRF